MNIEPVITEKTTKLAEEGKYTFRVNSGLNKFQIKKLIEDVFKVHVTGVHTQKIGGHTKKNLKGKIRVNLPFKKAIVSLKEKEKIELFETKKK